MLTNDIRDKYLEFFKRKAHSVVASDSLVPQNDPTLLFTGAGMNQFKENFLGIKKNLKRATSSQKCLRTGDLEEVGRTAFHHSFFEMLGNFSFGDYFKREAIHWAWEFLTVEMKISPARLRISVHKDDAEAYQIWRDEIKIRPDWLYKMGDKSNFWPANAPADGPNGPCGPCSEIYYDQDPAQGDGGSIDDDTGRFAEIWNLVFTQFDRQDGGKLVPLAQKNIDTGMGLERLACVLQGKSTNYETDIFRPINTSIEAKLGVKVPENSRRSLYAISDHVRAAVFAMADGVIPSNEGRGYVIRKIIRRALWHAHQLKPNHELGGPFLYMIVPSVVAVMRKPYPELAEAEAGIASMLKGEEERFLATLDTGLRILNERIKMLEKSGSKKLPGEIVFELYDTYGFPDELTRIIAESKGLHIDQKEFNDLMDEQRRRAKEATQISGSIFTATDLEKKLTAIAPTQFLGYTALESPAKVLLAEIQGSNGVLVLDQSPFYGESGGQVGDHGTIRHSGFEAKVVDSQKKDTHILLSVEVTRGSIKAGDQVTAAVDPNRRGRAMRNHTATHLLHAALRETLGKQVRQLGSLVAPEKLRFDYSYSQALAPDQMKRIEDLVNTEILKDTPVSKEEKSLEDAKADGAMAFFGEKYGSKVRVVTIPGFSKELCGGTHCDRTGQIGSFIIVSDSSIASGTRRIEALTGEGAVEYMRTLRSQMAQLAQNLKTTPAELNDRILKLQDQLKKLEKEKKQGMTIALDPKKILQEAKAAGGFRFAAHAEKQLGIDELRTLSDRLRSEGKQTVYLIASGDSDKVYFLLGLSPDLKDSKLDAREIWKQVSPLFGASGGGRKDLVQGGAPNNGQLQDKWGQAGELVLAYIKQHQ